MLRSVPARKWLAVLLPVVFGVTLLVAGAFAASDADAWFLYAVAAGIGAALPLAYTLQLVGEHRLFLRSDAAITRSRSRIGSLARLGWLIGGAAVAALAIFASSGKTAVYAALGGATLGIWPGLLANFIRLWREEWAPERSTPTARVQR